jgi:hypothetical protein
MGRPPKPENELRNKKPGLSFTQAGMDALSGLQEQMPGHSRNEVAEYAIVEALKRAKAGN